MELIKRNTAELVTEEEIRELIKAKKNPVVYCGYEASGEVHLGHLATITKLIDLEKAGFKVKVLFADYHTWLNRKGSWEEIKEKIGMWEKAFKKSGLGKAEYVLGSSFQKKNEYLDDLLTISLHTTMKRAIRSMQEIARDIEHATVSQTIYPLMQIVDMKYLEVDAAEAGLEHRKIHMLAREVMNKINYRKPFFVHTPVINSLLGSGGKMSSSVPSSIISVRDSEEDIKKKINKAYCPEGFIEGNPLLEIMQLIVFPRVKSIEFKRDTKFGGNISFNSFRELEKAFKEKKLHPQDLKKGLSEELIELLEPVRKAFE
ncbi:MAG: tyrosine--tRNA ligase [archaeon]